MEKEDLNKRGERRRTKTIRSSVGNKIKTLIIRKNNRITIKFSVKTEDLNKNVLYFYRTAQLVYKLHCISHWGPDNVFTDRSYKIMYF